MMKKREDLSPILESCLQALAAGVPLEQVLDQHPLQAGELRALLQIVEDLRLSSQQIGVPAHASAASKAQFLAHAEQRRKQKGLAAFWRWLGFSRPNLGSLAFGLGVFALLLIAISSTLALPGDDLYPVKLAAEQASLSVIEEPSTRLLREENFDQNRAEEVQKMLVENRENQVTFAGFLQKSSSGSWLAAGIPLEIDQNLLEMTGSLAGAYVEIKGHTHNDGQVHVQTLQPRLFKVEGVIHEVSSNGWRVGKLFVQRAPDTSITGEPQVGSRVRVEIARYEDRAEVTAFSIVVLEAAPTPSQTQKRAPVVAPSVTPEPDDANDDPQPTPEQAQTQTPDTTDSDHNDNDNDDDEKDSDDDDDEHSTSQPDSSVTPKSH